MVLPVVIQFWDKAPPAEVEALMQTWKAMACASGYEYVRFSDEAALDFIRGHFEPRIARAYLSCALPAMRADFFRYCALLKLPGIYADADTECVAPIAGLWPGGGRGMLMCRQSRVANDLMAVSHAEDPLLRRILETATRNIEARVSNNVWSVTGPGIATQLLQELGERDPLFDGFRLVDVKLVKQYVRFQWRLGYKSGADHWVIAQRERSIFRDADMSGVEPHAASRTDGP